MVFEGGGLEVDEGECLGGWGVFLEDEFAGVHGGVWFFVGFLWLAGLFPG